MTRKLRPEELPDWPAVLDDELAAAYCGGYATATFRAECPVVPFRRRGKDVWRRIDLDAWIASWGPKRAGSAAGDPLDRFGNDRAA